jgi:hypothetical protein
MVYLRCFRAVILACLAELMMLSSERVRSSKVGVGVWGGGLISLPAHGLASRPTPTVGATI